jgi:hypothetical protein
LKWRKISMTNFLTNNMKYSLCTCGNVLTFTISFATIVTLIRCTSCLINISRRAFKMDMWKYLCPRYGFHTNLFVSNNFLTKRSHILGEQPLSFATIVDVINSWKRGKEGHNQRWWLTTQVEEKKKQNNEKTKSPTCNLLMHQMCWS